LADNVRDITMNVTANTRQAEESLARLKGATEQAATSINKKAAASANGQTSLIAFSRVIQDSPYGIIGVANNIEQLTGAFLALKAQTGSTTSAISAMGSAFAGPMGFLVIMSLATAAMTIFSKNAKTAKQAVSEIKDAINTLIEVKNPLEGFKYFFEGDALAGLIAKAKGKVKELKNELNMESASGSLLTGLLSMKYFGRATQPINNQTSRTKKEIEEDLKAWEEVTKELQAKFKSFKTMQELAFDLDKMGYQAKSTKDPSGDKGTKEKITSFRETITEMLRTDELLGKLTTQGQMSEYIKQMTIELGKYKEGTKEFNDAFEFIIELKKKQSLLYDMRAALEEEDKLKFDKMKWDGEGAKWLLSGLQGIGGENMYRENKKFFGTMVDSPNIDWVKDKNNILIKEGVKQAKKQFETYKNYFIDPFTDAFKGEFSKAWQSIFGEANSLLEKFIQSLSEKLFNYGVEKAAYGLMDLIFPGSGALGGAISGGGADSRTVNQIIIDGELIATQKQANRIKAQLDRQAALR